MALRNKSLDEREILYSMKIAAKLKKVEVPKFSLGVNHLSKDKGENDFGSLIDFVEDCRKSPYKYFGYKNFEKKQISLYGRNLEFESFISQKDTARFYCNFQPKWRSGSKIGVIVIPHWNGAPKKYIQGTSWLRRLFLPLNTAVYLPAYEDSKMYTGGAKYNVLGPNIGLTIRRVQQDVLNIQCCAEYLKEYVGCEEIGIWSYSIGSLRGFLSAIFAPKLFDFSLFHLMCDNFAEAVVNGISTKELSDVLKDNISFDKLDYAWSVISPGQYTEYMGSLPKYTRIVQGTNDLVFGRSNVENFNKKLREYAPSAEVYKGDFGHLTLCDVAKTLPVLLGNVKFVYKNSGLGFF